MTTAQSPTRFPVSDLARVRSATHEIVTIHASIRCPAVWLDRAGDCTCGAGLRYALRRKGGKRR